MTPLLRRSIRGASRRSRNFAETRARRLGLLPYKPERRTSEEWSAAYAAGALDYYGQLDELGRYSAIVGYFGWAASRAGIAGASVLDVGCGSGLLRARLAGAPLGDYVGIDVSDVAIESAREQGFASSNFIVGDFRTAELGRFDVVILNEVLYYADDPTAFLERARHLLLPDGVVLVSVWRHPGDHLLWRRVESTLDVVDRVEIRNRANPVNSRGWIVACCRAPA